MVVLAGRREDRLNALARELGSENAEAVPADVTDERAMVALVDRAVTRFGRLDVMLNNAGVIDGGPGETESLLDFERVMRVNLTAVFTGCREAARVMLPAGKGSIVNIASVAGLGSLSERYPLAGYVASKSGVVGLTRELGAQWAARGVRVNAIAPGWFPSEMTGELRDQRQVRWVQGRTPIGRVGRLEELDGVLVFLASDASSFVIGQTIAVDGGWTVW
jgi:NAD(P)-dependent dehydrogenase (short-subunit alcohol dehydrogenase family)